QVLDRVDPVAAEVEQRQDRGLAGPVAEALVEAGDLFERVAARSGQKADARNRLTRQLEHQAIERRGALLHREPATPHGEDRPTLRHAAIASPLWTKASVTAPR